jgi:hypothetical protein
VPCSETYRGASAGSEPETQILQNEARRLGPLLATSIHLHTYGQLWLIPWGSYADDGATCNFADDDAEMVCFVSRKLSTTQLLTWCKTASCAN